MSIASEFCEEVCDCYTPMFFICQSLIISIAKTASKKIGALILSMKFLFPIVALYKFFRSVSL